MICAPGLIFIGTKGLEYRIQVFRSRTHFRRYRGRRVSFSCFALPDSFSAVPRVSGPVFIFGALGLVLGGSEGVGSSCQVLRSLTHFWLYREREVPFSCLAHVDSFSAVLRASSPVFMFRAPEQIFNDTMGVGSIFHLLRC
jgi:hypothetical protein